MALKYPKLGMTYKQAIKTATRHAKEGSQHVVASMANQVRLHEGNRAAQEFYREASAKGREQQGRKYF